MFFCTMVFSTVAYTQQRFLVLFVDSQSSTDVLAVLQRHGGVVSDILSDFKMNAS